MVFTGMDPTAMRAVARGLQARGRELEDMVHTIDGLVSQCVSAWPGDASLAFHDAWHAERRSGFSMAAGNLADAAHSILRQVEQQEEASATNVGRPAAAPGPGAAVGASALGDVLAGGLRVATGVTTVAGVLGSVWNTQWHHGEVFTRWEDALPHGGLLGGSLAVIGVAGSAADLATAISEKDWSRGLSASADLGFTFASAPVSLLWSGLKSEVGFFIPLDAESQAGHLAWMEEQGHDAAEIAERYAGLDGFVQLGNDNVERQAPWANDLADAALQKPAEWLLAAGIDLG